jgi:hypothetical protein
MTETLSRDLMIGMLRKGQTGSQILEILNAIASTDEVNEDALEVEAA